MAYIQRPCTHCGLLYPPTRTDQVHCSTVCRRLAQTRELTRSRQAYRALYHMAAGNGASFTELTRVARGWVKEDKASGAPPPPLPERLAVAEYWKAYEARTGKA